MVLVLTVSRNDWGWGWGWGDSFTICKDYPPIYWTNTPYSAACSINALFVPYISNDNLCMLTNEHCTVKDAERIPQSYLPSLATSCKNMASHRDRIMEKTQKFQIVYTSLIYKPLPTFHN